MDQPTLLLVGTFVLILAVVLLPYWLLVLQPEQKAKQSLRKRITTTAAVSPIINVGILKRAEQLSKIGIFNRLLSQTSLGPRVIKSLIDQANVRVTVGVVLLASGILLFGVATLAMHFLHFGLLLAFGSGALGAWAPILALQVLAKRRLNKFEEQFPEAIDLLGRTLRAGHAFSTGLQVASQELPDPVGTEFRVVYERQNFGMPISEALRDFAERVPLLDARFFVTAVLTQQESGGNLTEVLDNLAAVIRERFRVKRQLRVISSHGRFTAVVLSAMPPVLAAFMFFRSPESLTILLGDPLGQRMIAIAVVLQLIGVVLIRKIADVKY